MPRPRTTQPSYCRDKSSGRALVVLNGKRVWLGKDNTPELRKKYDHVVAEWTAGGCGKPVEKPVTKVTTVAHVLVHFWRHARTYYRDADGNTAAEAFNYCDALRPVLKRYSRTPAVEFGPLALKRYAKR